MENKVMGYVLAKKDCKTYPFIEKDDNGYCILVGKEENWFSKSEFYVEVEVSEQQTNAFIQNVYDIIDQQQEKGLKKYGTLVNKEDYSLLGWIDHAQQEAADLLIYLEVIKAKVKDVIG